MWKKIWGFIKEEFCKVKHILFAILILFVAFFTILILPVMSKVLVNYNVFSSLDEIKTYIALYNNKYTVIFSIFGLLILLFIFGDREKIVETIGKFSFSVKHGDTSLSISKDSDAIKDVESRKMLTEALLDKSKENVKSNENDNSKNSIQKIKSILDINNNKDSKKKNGNKQKDTIEDEYKRTNEKLQEENDTLRFYATYNIVNKKTKELLTQIYYEKYIESYKFKELIIKSYQKNNRNNKNISRNNLKIYANDKCETIFNALNYLNIIDLSEDNKEIRLTEKGKKFVDEYIIKERWFE